MRLLSLYILAFGGVEERAYTLERGLTEVLEENGAGKTTLAAFIKAMLYGLDGVGMKSLSDNEYSRYAPWGKSRFGGTLTLEHGGHTYRIERYFSHKNKATKQIGDLRVIDVESERVTDALGDVPGRTLLGVDGESFLRTAYLSSDGMRAGKTRDITAKLGGLEDEEWDMRRVDAAIALLEEKRKEIRTRTKQHSGRKELDLCEAEIAACEQRIREAQAAIVEEERAAALAEEKEALCRRERTEYEALSAVKAQADRRAGEARARAAQIEAEREEITARERRVAELRSHFPVAAPTAAEWTAINEALGKYTYLTRELAATPTVDAAALPSEEDFATASRHQAAYREAVAAIPSEPREAEGEVRTAPTLWIAAALLAILAAVTLIFSAIPAAILLVGAIALGVLAAVRGRRAEEKRRVRESAHRAWEETRNAAERKAEEAKVALAAALHAVFLDEAADEVAVATRKAQVGERRREAEERQRKHGEKEALALRLAEAIAPYRGLPTGAEPAVAVRELERLTYELESAERALEEGRAKLTRLTERPMEAAEEAQLSPAELTVAITEREERIKTLTAEAAAARERAEGYHRIADGIDELCDTREELLAARERLCARLDMLDATVRFLRMAGENIEVRYLGGIRAGIGKYTDRLLGKRIGEVRLDADLLLSFAEGGEGHSVEFFSTGLRAIADVCLRLALTDELYPKDAPPLILDDPFVALDEPNLAEARTLLLELAEERQIIYLTCHPSRSLRR